MRTGAPELGGILLLLVLLLAVPAPVELSVVVSSFKVLVGRRRPQLRGSDSRAIDSPAPMAGAHLWAGHRVLVVVLVVVEACEQVLGLLLAFAATGCVRDKAAVCSRSTCPAIDRLGTNKLSICSRLSRRNHAAPHRRRRRGRAAHGRHRTVRCAPKHGELQRDSRGLVSASAPHLAGADSHSAGSPAFLPFLAPPSSMDH
jgi:hypothetical protein